MKAIILENKGLMTVNTVYKLKLLGEKPVSLRIAATENDSAVEDNAVAGSSP
jgi:hypothetical protein